MPTLHWIGKEKVVNHHQDVPFRVLEHQFGFDADKGKSEQQTDSGNKIIHGDNLEALKSLLPEYEGKIDCIYIDPPYNTGNEEWIYNDNVNHPKIKKWLGDVVGREGDDLTRHDKWLCMMYPRLVLLNHLLKKEGKIVISIGHHEIHNLLLICREIFGTKQIVPITLQTSGGKPSGGFNYQHEYMVFIVPRDFSANKSKYSGGKARSPFEGLTLATFDQTQRPNQTYPIFVNKTDGTLHGTGLSLQERIDNGDYKGNLEEFEFDFDEAPEGTVALWPITSKGDKCVWRLIADRLEEDWKEGHIKIGKNRYKKNPNKFSVQYLPSGVIDKLKNGELKVIGTEKNAPTLIFGDNKTVGGQVPTIWSEKDFFTVKGTSKMNEIFGKKVFNYPKPIELINEVLRAITTKNDVVLDSFSGSGTTAHAVQNLNLEDNGERKFILIEMEDYASTVTAERMKRVMTGYGKGSKKIDGTGGQFDYYNLGSALFNDSNLLNEDVKEDRIREYVWYSETKAAFPKERAEDAHKHVLGTKDETDYYFFYEKDAITTLNHNFLATIKKKADQYVIYADNCLLSKEFLQSRNIIFKKIPRDISRF
jgi:adenine-specific DNA-methyltransferase